MLCLAGNVITVCQLPLIADVPHLGALVFFPHRFDFLSAMLQPRPHYFRFADIEVREREFAVIKAGEVLPVEPKAFRVLLILLRNPQKLITKEELLNSVWGDAAVSENSLTMEALFAIVQLPATGG